MPNNTPLMDAVANKVIQKYQTSTCEQLWQKRSQKPPPSQQDQNLIAMLKSDPQMRQAFLGQPIPRQPGSKDMRS